ncbi:MAG TPA: hypothetical protein VNS22_01960 [Geminicoccus sp.]|uniref:hypothetical protein n=1 Tax=Geminicoccus sp. TaxID=2024832 RepID=UPI002C435B19|nr:hypothetical protein [Geminicoccus sp.]HWL67128.1 hypothetical protein [Geminicoccus sp.]
MTIAFRFRTYRRGGGSNVLALPGLVAAFDGEASLPDFVERQHGAGVPVLTDLSRRADALQPSTDQHPTVDLTSAPGRVSIAFGEGQRMTIDPPGGRILTVVAAVMVPASATAAQVLLTQDTSATTDNPAWEVRIG